MTRDHSAGGTTTYLRNICYPIGWLGWHHGSFAFRQKVSWLKADLKKSAENMAMFDMSCLWKNDHQLQHVGIYAVNMPSTWWYGYWDRSLHQFCGTTVCEVILGCFCWQKQPTILEPFFCKSCKMNCRVVLSIDILLAWFSLNHIPMSTCLFWVLCWG